MNCNRDCELANHTLWNAELIRLMEGILFLSKRWWLWKGELCCIALVALKRACCVVQQLKCQASCVTGSIQVTTICMDTRSQSFLPLTNYIVHHTVLKFSLCLNKPLSQLMRIGDWYLVYMLLHHAPDLGHDCWLAAYQEWWTWVSHSAEARLCHELDVLVHCLAGRQARPQQCCRSLAAALVLATHLDSTVQVTLSKKSWLNCTVTVARHFIMR